MDELNELRAEIAELHRKRARGDVPEKAFQKQNDEKIVALFRALARTCMAEGETIRAEHHVVRAHTRLTSSVLRQSEQELISLFATDRQLVEVRITSKPDVPVRGDKSDGLRLSALPLSRAVSLVPGRRIRMSELAAGAVILAVGVIGHSMLGVTGPALATVGAAGILHSLLVPVRWVDVRGTAADALEAIRIHAVWRKSARSILSHVRLYSSGPGSL